MQRRRPPLLFFQSWRQAAGALWANPLRAGLGALAIAAAVATLVLVETAVDGLTVFARESAARAFGSETFVVAQVASPGQTSRRELERKLLRNPEIRPADLRFLEQYADQRVLYAPLVQRTAEVVAASRKAENATVAGTGAYLPLMRDLAIETGRFFLPREERAAAQVAVLGEEIAGELFPTSDPLGRVVRLGGRGFQVIGVQERLGNVGGRSLDRYVWVPFEAWRRVYGDPGSLQIQARAPSGLHVELAEDRARASLRARRQLAPGVEDTFDLLAPEATRNFVVALVRRIGGVAPLLSAMAFLAAVVVVSNTILVSVSQRTFEIGVRRAVGATQRQILYEVLAESTLLSLLGGALGTTVVALLAQVASGALDLEIAVSGQSVGLAVVSTGLAGLLAGAYPAWRATQIDVIRALRVE